MRGAAGMVVLCALAACDDGGKRFVPPPDATTVATPSSSAPKKPARVYYLANEAEKCEVYWLEDGHRSIKKRRACPREVAVGEKIRLTGRNCIRESLEPARNVPVRCPRELYKAAEADEHGTDGPERLPPAAASGTSG